MYMMFKIDFTHILIAGNLFQNLRTSKGHLIKLTFAGTKWPCRPVQIVGVGVAIHEGRVAEVS